MNNNTLNTQQNEDGTYEVKKESESKRIIIDTLARERRLKIENKLHEQLFNNSEYENTDDSYELYDSNDIQNTVPNSAFVPETTPNIFNVTIYKQPQVIQNYRGPYPLPMQNSYNMQHESNLYNRNNTHFSNINKRKLDAIDDFEQIRNYEMNRYNSDKARMQAILFDINRPNQPICLCRYDKIFYYRPTQYAALKSYDEKELAKEISSRCNNVNIQLVDDLNDALSYQQTKIKIDTTYIAINNIPVVDDEVFDINQIDEIFKNKQGLLSRNYLSYTPYLRNRFYDFEKDINN